jgi:hypothetical protein
MPKQFASSLRQHNWSKMQRGGNALRFAPALTAPPIRRLMSHARAIFGVELESLFRSATVEGRLFLQ